MLLLTLFLALLEPELRSHMSRKSLVPSDAPGSESKYGESFIEVRNWSKQLREPLLVELQTETDDGVTAYEKWWMGISSRSVHFWTDNRENVQVVPRSAIVGLQVVDTDEVKIKSASKVGKRVLFNLCGDGLAAAVLYAYVWYHASDADCWSLLGLTAEYCGSSHGDRSHLTFWGTYYGWWVVVIGLLPVAALMQVAALVVYMEKPPKMLKGSAVHIVTTREELVFQIDDHLPQLQFFLDDPSGADGGGGGSGAVTRRAV